MKIERENRAEVRLQDFAEQYGLVMRVTEYASPPRAWRFAALFVGAEVSNGHCLTTTFGDGDTEDQAIADYARRIGKVKLIVDATTSKRREIYTPMFLPYVPENSPPSAPTN